MALLGIDIGGLRVYYGYVYVDICTCDINIVQ